MKTNHSQQDEIPKGLPGRPSSGTSSLSDCEQTGYYSRGDVKEFIKRLLDWAEHFKGKDIPWNWVIGKIKFEAGKDLK